MKRIICILLIAIVVCCSCGVPEDISHEEQQVNTTEATEGVNESESNNWNIEERLEGIWREEGTDNDISELLYAFEDGCFVASIVDGVTEKSVGLLDMIGTYNIRYVTPIIETFNGAGNLFKEFTYKIEDDKLILIGSAGERWEKIR